MDQQTDEGTVTNYYMKGVTKIDNLGWLNTLGNDLIIQRSLPIHDFDNRANTSLEAKKELVLAKKMAQAKGKSSGALISYDGEADQVLVFS